MAPIDDRTAPEPLRIGVVGLGSMGAAVACRLGEDAAFRVIGHDVAPARMARLVELTPSAKAVASLADLVAACDAVVTCLPAGDAVQAVYLGADGICARLRVGQASIDLSTVAPQKARLIAEAVADVGGLHVEAPVIGSVEDGAQGRLHVIISARGVTATVDLPVPVLRILQRIGARIAVAGPPGAASLVKVVQNGLGLVQLVAIAEALGVCAAAGLDRGLFAGIVGSAPGMANSPLFRRVAPAMIDPAREEGSARLAIAAKDARLFTSVAREARARAPLAATAALAFAEAEDSGLAEADFTRVADLFGLEFQER